MLAFLFFLLVLAAAIIAIAVLVAAKCHEAWVEFLTGPSEDSNKTEN